MPTIVNDEKEQLVTRALEQADHLVTLVIKGDGHASRAALDLARTLYDLKHKHGQTTKR